MIRRVTCGVCGRAIHGVADYYGAHPPHTSEELAPLLLRVEVESSALAFGLYLRLWHDGQTKAPPLRGAPTVRSVRA